MTPPHLATAGNEPMDLFAVLRERDVLVHHPYDSFATSVEAFVAQAADDPDVLGIKQTLYRTSGDSPIVASLIQAAEAGKQVAAIVELKARFDEQANIAWARKLEEAGVHVVYGLVGLKTHSKTVLVLRREEDGIRRYCHVGTGNYNSKTARIYEDLGLLTADPDIGADVGDLFNYLTGFSRHTGYRQILVSPVTLRRRIIELIEEQAEAGPAGRIVIKLNGLTDPEMIDALYRPRRPACPSTWRCAGCAACARASPSCPRPSGCARSWGSSSSTRGSTVSGGARTTRPTAATASSRPPTVGRSRCSSARPTSWSATSTAASRCWCPSRPRAASPAPRDPDLVFADDSNAWVLGADQRWRRVPTRRGVSAQRRLKELAVERARRRREVEPRPSGRSRPD